MILSRRIALGGVLLAGWPVLRWYVLRLRDGSDEPLGLLALAVALFFAPRAGWGQPVGRVALLVLLGLISILILAEPWLPALVRALLMVTMVGVVVAPPRIGFGWTALLALSLPVMATLQFYLGYPLRVATAFLSALLLRTGGLDVQADATTLLWAGERVIVDAPCSGLHMAWSGAFVAATVGCWLKLPWSETVRLFRWTGAIIFAANLIRSMVLFMMGAGLWRLPSFAHEGIGLVLFAVAVVAIYLRASRTGETRRAQLVGASA